MKPVTKLALVALIGLASFDVPKDPLRAQSTAEPASMPPCPTAGTYTADVDGAPDKGTCRQFIDQLQPVSFNIPPGDLFDALKAYLEQSGQRGLVPLDIMMANLCIGSNCVRGPIPTAGVSGTMPPRDALNRLLEGTGVTFMQDQAGTFRFPALKDAPGPGGRCVWKRAAACPAG